MSRANPIVLAVVLFLFTMIYGGLPLLKGGLYLDTHEGDTYHFIDALLRMADGQMPHLDFMTPLGWFSFLPIVAFLDAGYTLGTAIPLGQLAVALLLWPIVVYACATRLTRTSAYLFGVFVLGFVVTLTYGGPYPGVAISMNYNRWAWAIVFAALLLAFLPSKGEERPRLDGAIIGAMFAVVLLIKMTYFVALLPAAALMVVARWKIPGLVSALVSGAAVLLVVTLVTGPSFWLAYLSDLQIVLGNEIRPNVGKSLHEVTAGKFNIGVTLLAMVSILLVRRTGNDGAAIALMLLVPGFIYVTYQNFANDPIWIVFVVLLLLQFKPEEGAMIGPWDLRQSMVVGAAAGLAMIFPSLYNTAISSLEHTAYKESRFVPMIPESKGHQDLFVRIDRGNEITAQVYLDQEIEVWSEYSEIIGREPKVEFEGITFRYCELEAGSRAHFERIARDLQEKGIPEGSRLFTTDILIGFWLFGPYEPPENGAVWYYGNLTGLANSDYVLIPKCSFVSPLRRVMVKDLKNSDFKFSLVENNDLYALFSVSR